MSLVMCCRLPDVYIGYWQCSESYTQGSFQWQIGCALALWWLSQMWIAGHIWLPKCERLAKAERWAARTCTLHMYNIHLHGHMYHISTYMPI